MTETCVQICFHGAKENFPLPLPPLPFPFNIDAVQLHSREKSCCSWP